MMKQQLKQPLTKVLKKQKLLLILLLFLGSMIAKAQCTDASQFIPFPASGVITQNGVTMTITFTGSASSLSGAQPFGCFPGNFPTPFIYLTGGNVIVNFNKPVNNAVFFIAGFGGTPLSAMETISITTNNGTPTVTGSNVCGNITVLNNTVSGNLATALSNGGNFKVTAPAPYTQLIISGASAALSGVAIATCGTSIVAAAPTVQDLTICQGTTANLNNANLEGTPAQVEWHATNDANSPVMTNITAVGTGTYYAFFTVASGKPRTTGSAVTITSRVCLAPGGVTTGLSYWYRADKNATNTGAATDVTAWTDMWNGTTVAQLGTNGLPKYVLGTSTYFNFNPGINFTVGTQTLGNIAVQTLTSQNYDVFTFTKEGLASGGINPRLFSIGMDNTTTGAANWDAFGIFPNTSNLERRVYNGGTQFPAVAPVFNATIPSIMYFRNTNTATSKGLNGAAMSASTAYAAVGSQFGGHMFGNTIFSSNGSDNAGFIGHIGETIVYGAGTISDTDRRKVDSYLAIKYGITLGQLSSTGHYLDTDGNIVWNGGSNTTYNNNIFGVSRDDIEVFEQKVSRSVNSGAILTVATTNDFVNQNQDAARTGFSNDKTYFLLGDNNNTTTPLTAITANSIAMNRIARIWLSQRKNTPNLLYFQASLSTYGTTFASGNTVYMVVADDAAFTTNAKTIAGSYVGGQWVFSNSFDSDNVQRYITFATSGAATACPAGTTAPTVNAAVTNNCPTTTVNLNTQAHTGTIPSGTTLVWFTNNAHTGTAYATPTAATAGTYYAFYYSSASNCYSPASNAVTATTPACPCPAGDTAPSVNTFVATQCPSGTANLNTQAHTGAVPLNSTLLWFTDATHTTSVPTPAAVGAGTYYAFYYSSSSDCYSPASAPINVVAFVCSACTAADPMPANLSNIDVPAAPAGAVTQWHNSATPSASTLLSSTTVMATSTPTNYWVYYYDTTNHCYSPGSKATVVSNACCNYPTVNLSQLSHSAVPNGSTLVWYANSTHDFGTQISDPLAVGNGTYWPFFYDAVSNCYSPAGTPVIVAVDNVCSTACYKPGITTGTALDTKVGISALGRAGEDDADKWPMTRKGGWIALEAKTKGFVPNRVAFSDADSNPSTPDVPVGIDPANFLEGMMVYDITNKCLKVYTLKDDDADMAWHCVTTQTCPD